MEKKLINNFEKTKRGENMRKNKYIVITSLILFLMLSIGIIVPVQAEINKTTVKQFSSETILSALKTISIKAISNNTAVISSPSEVITAQKTSETGFKLSTKNEATGAIHVIEVNQKGTMKSIFVDGKQLALIPSNKTATNLNIEYSAIPISDASLTYQDFGSRLVSEAQSQDVSLLTEGDGVNHFVWDNVNFVSGGYGSGSIRYPHPDKDYYGINIYQNWATQGSQLIHYMFNYDISTALGAAGEVAICAAIGVIIGSLVGAPSIGGLIGTVIGVVAWVFTGDQVLDENGNLWWWINNYMILWLASNLGVIYWLMNMNYAAAVAYVCNAFVSSGYLRIGPYLFADGIGLGEPSPPADPFWVSSITYTQAYGSGAVNNPNGLIGSSNNGNYVQLWGGNPGDGGQIIGWMNQVAHGHIYLYGHSGSGYYTHLYTYVSYNNNNDWTQTSVQTVSGTNDRWIDCGSYSGNFRYIAIVGIDDTGNSANIFIDSVKVQP